MLIFPTPESPAIHPNKWVDALTRTHVLAVPTVFVPLALLTAAWGIARAGAAPGWSLVAAALGFVAWTLTEYGMHRTVFHWEHDSDLGRAFHYTVHGVHHKLPDDPYRLVMPLWVSVPIYALLGAGFVAAAPLYGWGFLAGFGVGYMVYDVTHFYLHHNKPVLAFHKRLRSHHMNHHFNKAGRKYGVSFMIWDRVFGTL